MIMEELHNLGKNDKINCQLTIQMLFHFWYHNTEFHDFHHSVKTYYSAFIITFIDSSEYKGLKRVSICFWHSWEYYELWNENYVYLTIMILHLLKKKGKNWLRIYCQSWYTIVTLLHLTIDDWTKSLSRNNTKCLPSYLQFFWSAYCLHYWR